MGSSAFDLFPHRGDLREKGNIHLVGSVPVDTATQAFETCAKALGPHLATLPDGEVGYRSFWIVCQAVHVFNRHPQIELVNRPAPIDGKEQWLPKDYKDQWRFKLKSGPIAFDDLGYAQWASESYAAFKQLRGRGVVPQGVRFQVALPTPLCGSQHFFSPDDGKRLIDAYRAAMLKEIEKLCRAIPPDELAIQWDTTDAAAIEKEQLAGSGSDAWNRWRDDMAALGPAVPRDVALGYHICYGDFNHRHVIEPKNLSVSVRMLNEAAARAGRPLDFVHVPVPIDRNDDAYFAPLRDLSLGDARVFLGLVHYHGGVDGTWRRADAAHKHLDDFGIATECGFGRRSPETLTELLRIHRNVADRMAP